jgi:hypothetical protein
MCAVPSMVVFVSSFRAFPVFCSGVSWMNLRRFQLPLLLLVSLLFFKFHMLCISIVSYLYFRTFSASFLTTFLSPKIANLLTSRFRFHSYGLWCLGWYYYYYYYYYYHRVVQSTFPSPGTIYRLPYLPITLPTDYPTFRLPYLPITLPTDYPTYRLPYLPITLPTDYLTYRLPYLPITLPTDYPTYRLTLYCYSGSHPLRLATNISILTHVLTFSFHVIPLDSITCLYKVVGKNYKRFQQAVYPFWWQFHYHRSN